ncbi:Polyribonucleotide 5-hydroxyl-kinase Clp1/Grc3 like protein [Aduncisulcus paluster]|uniref:Polyribonucleotide 5-hydroxyl-kinase Clp1/Grc3 like protein n=1 Tax=Aduncisulcus paluster TaxID=2918883 RepID=A0ABQ5KSY0_9EUKA|nr:Polyribonucleotide 5-hydroxyl-kinase Clp1/Grc3 like protein [Aduncisulcus paluster]
MLKKVHIRKNTWIRLFIPSPHSCYISVPQQKKRPGLYVCVNGRMIGSMPVKLENDINLAVYAFEESYIELEGDFIPPNELLAPYRSKLYEKALYIHCILDLLRRKDESSKGAVHLTRAGPVLMVLGSNRFEKQIFETLLLEFAYRSSFTPLFVDLNLRQHSSFQSFNPSGCISAGIIDKDVEHTHITCQRPLSLFVGVETPSMSPLLYCEVCKKMASLVKQKQECQTHSSGVIISVTPEICNIHGDWRLKHSNLSMLLLLVKAFAPTIILNTDSDEYLNIILRQSLPSNHCFLFDAAIPSFGHTIFPPTTFSPYFYGRTSSFSVSKIILKSSVFSGRLFKVDPLIVTVTESLGDKEEEEEEDGFTLHGQVQAASTGPKTLSSLFETISGDPTSSEMLPSMFSSAPLSLSDDVCHNAVCAVISYDKGKDVCDYIGKAITCLGYFTNDGLKRGEVCLTTPFKINVSTHCFIFGDLRWDGKRV